MTRRKGPPVELHCCDSMDGFHDHDKEPNLGWEDEDDLDENGEPVIHHLVLYLVLADSKAYTTITREVLQEILENHVDEDVLIRVSPCPRCVKRGVIGPRFTLTLDKRSDDE